MLEVRVDGQLAGIARDDTRGRRVVDEVSFEALQSGARTVTVKHTARHTQGARRLDGR